MGASVTVGEIADRVRDAELLDLAAAERGSERAANCEPQGAIAFLMGLEGEGRGPRPPVVGPIAMTGTFPTEDENAIEGTTLRREEGLQRRIQRENRVSRQQAEIIRRTCRDV